MKIGIKVLLKTEVLDVEGRAVSETLKREGISISECRVGKYIVLQFPTEDKAKALKWAEDATKSTLYNPLIETYQIEEVP